MSEGERACGSGFRVEHLKSTMQHLEGVWEVRRRTYSCVGLEVLLSCLGVLNGGFHSFVRLVNMALVRCLRIHTRIYTHTHIRDVSVVCVCTHINTYVV